MAIKALGAEIATRAKLPGHFGGEYQLPNPDVILRRLGKQIEAYRDLLADPHVGGAIKRRKSAVKAMERGLNRGKVRAKVVKFVEAVLDRLDMDRIVSEILDAPLYGYQPLEVIWTSEDGRWLPTDVIGKPPEWFCFDGENRLRFKSAQNMMPGELLPARKFLLARQDATYDNPYGFADLSLCFWPVTFKHGSQKFWLKFAERFGSPWIIGKHPRGTPSSENDLFLDKLESMVQDALAVIPDDSSVEVLESGDRGSSADVYERLIKLCVSEINIALLGQNQTTEADANRASSTAGADVVKTIRDGDAKMVTGVINQLIRWLVEVNFGPTEVCPTYGLWEQEEVDDTLAKRDEILTRAGVKFTTDYFMRTYGLLPGDIEEDTQAVDNKQAAAGNPTTSDIDDNDDSDADDVDGKDDEDKKDKDSAAEFAETDKIDPWQQGLDDTIDAIKPSDMQAQVDALLQPVIDAVQAGVSEDEIDAALLRAYQSMNTGPMQDRLRDAFFSVGIWGQLSAQAALDETKASTDEAGKPAGDRRKY